MMTLLEFGRLGFAHIVNASALDHILFLVALVAGYSVADWRHLVGVATAFTVGHSVTLVAAATGVLALPDAWIEFLIPVTIVVTCGLNLRRLGARPAGLTAPVMAAGFGLVHGAGFANYLAEMFASVDPVSLLGFNLGIEAGQLLLLAGMLTVATLIGRPRARAAVASVAAGVWALTIALNRFPG